MNNISITQKWDSDFFKQFSQSEDEFISLKESINLQPIFMAVLLRDDQNMVFGRFIISITNTNMAFIGHYLADEKINILLESRDTINNFCTKHKVSELKGPIDFNIFNHYRFTYDAKIKLPWHAHDQKKAISDFIEFGFQINHKWYLISYSRILGLLRLFSDQLKTLQNNVLTKTHSSATLDDIYKVVMKSYEDMPYFQNPGLELFKLWNKDLLSYYKEDERIFYYKDEKLVAFCLFKKLNKGLKSQLVFTHVGRLNNPELSGVSRDMHLRISKLQKLRTLINPPLFDLVHENSPIFNYLPPLSYKRHATYVTMSFIFS